ncbi:MAG: hypothetical protein L0H79_10640 [Intrasporangium sp.]|uniref:helix-turn-helix transcriptional regulator n=1 Tax=Intrasporangium sp. TaxID=1925024 RepID=UPI002646FC40|nr:helix-turn-helix domain-containing protein [Intrasporangium sp.]MDN5796191.1 hypothetical protein [Intrasporangium sp.]
MDQQGGQSFDDDVTGIAALADPVRRELYRHVCAQTGPVGRDAAAAAVGISRHQAKFHLDRLEADGLLVAGYVRLTGRTGPGAGRPAKVYRRADREIAVSLPQRQYELAGQILADAIDESLRASIPISEAVRSTAAAHGHAIGVAAQGRAGAASSESVRRAGHDDHDNTDRDDDDRDDLAEVGPPRPTGPEEDPLDVVITVLAEHGYEPRREGERVVMANCPFHSLVQAHTELVCTLNHALITGITDRLAPGAVCACLDPGENRCCVTLRGA